MDIIQLITIIYLAGIIFSSYITLPPTILILCAALSGASVLLFRKSNRIITALICAFAFFTSLCLYQADNIIDNNTSLGEYLNLRPDRERIEMVSGTVLDGREKKDGSYEFLLSVNSVRRKPGDTIPVKGKLSARSWGENIFRPEYGDKVEIEGWIQSASEMKRKSAAYYRKSGITGRMRIAEDGVNRKTGRGNVPLVMSAGKSVRDRFINTLSERVGGDEADVMGRMLLGKQQEVSPDMEEAFRKAGLSHALVVSGMHVGFMMSAFLALSFLWARKPIISFVLLSCVLVFYYGLTGGGSSVTRATIMGFVFLGGLLRGSGYNARRSIFVAALLMMFMEPLCIYNVGVQLTFLASAGVIFIYPLLLMFFVNSRNPNILIKALLVSISAQLPILPILAYYFNNFCAISPLSNVVVVPLISILLPLTLLTCIAGILPSVFAPMAAGVALATKLFATIIIQFTQFFSSLNYGNIDVASPSIWWILLFEIAVFSFAYALWQSYYGTDEKADYGFYALAASVVLLMIPVVWNAPFTGITSTFIDVGEGDSTYVEISETPGKKFRMLVDAGGSWGYSEMAYDPGERAVGMYLKKKGVHRLDALALTHPEADHMNGLLWIAENIKVENFLDVGMPKNITCEIYSDHPYCGRDTKEPELSMPEGQVEKYRRILAALKKQGTKYEPIRGGMRFETANGGTISILSPDELFLKDTESASSTNNLSAVIKISYGANSALLPGDVEKPAEGRLLMYQGGFLDSTIMKSPHHGSGTSSTMDFVKAVAPKVVVISTGGPSFYGHPNKRVLENYAAAGAELLRTDRNGTVTCRLSGVEVVECSTEIME